MHTIDKLDAIAALREVVDEVGPEHVAAHYNFNTGEPTSGPDTCRYAYHGRPDCIVGRALDKIGVPNVGRLDFEDSDETVYSPISVGSGDFKSRLRELGYALTDSASIVLGCAQNTQDAGNSFGKALAEAEKISEVA